MKKKIIKISMIIILVILIIAIFFDNQNIEKDGNIEQNNNTKTQTKFVYANNTKKSNVFYEEKKEYETIPRELKGNKVIGKLEVPSINLETYILEETTDKTLNVSVTKLKGPQINEIGNFCIIGHNYPKSNMFFKLNKVKIDDEIILTNTFDKSVKYRLYETKEVYPNEVEVLSQDTEEEREVTLITCTFGAIKRIVVKGIEIYD